MAKRWTLRAELHLLLIVIFVLFGSLTLLCSSAFDRFDRLHALDSRVQAVFGRWADLLVRTQSLLASGVPLVETSRTITDLVQALDRSLLNLQDHRSTGVPALETAADDIDLLIQIGGQEMRQIHQWLLDLSQEPSVATEAVNRPFRDLVRVLSMPGAGDPRTTDLILKIENRLEGFEELFGSVFEVSRVRAADRLQGYFETSMSQLVLLFWSVALGILGLLVVLLIRIRRIRQVMDQTVTDRTSALETALESLGKTQTELVQSKSQANLVQFTAGMAHQMNSPLASIRSISESLWTSAKGYLEVSGPGFLGFLETRAVQQVFARLGAEEPLAPPTKEQRLELRRLWLRQGKDPDTNLFDLLVATDLSLAREVADWPLEAATVQTLEWAALSAQARRLISSSVDRCSGVIQALLVFSRNLGPEDAQDQDLFPSLERALAGVRRLPGIQVETEFQPPIRAYCVAHRCDLVWDNLIRNALAAMEGRGTLGLRAWSDETHCVVEVLDSGPGVPSELVDRIFDPFFSTRPTSLGLGLGVCRTLVESMGGTIGHRRGERTVFQVRLPRRP